MHAHWCAFREAVCLFLILAAGIPMTHQGACASSGTSKQVLSRDLLYFVQYMFLTVVVMIALFSFLGKIVYCNVS